MAKFHIKANPLIPYTYHLNTVSFNKDRTITSLVWKKTKSQLHNGTLIAHLPQKSVSKL